MHSYLDTLYEIFIANHRYMYIIDGLIFSVSVTILSAVMGLILGVIISGMRISHIGVLRSLSTCYVNVIRGTPAIVQLLILANVIFVGWLKDVSIFNIAIIAFGINSSAYVSEIIRAGIVHLPKGQFEAASALGLNYYLSMRYVILPQAFKKILPALVNEFIALLKETSVIGFIGGIDLLRGAKIITAQTYRGIEPLLAVGIIYLILTTIFTLIMRRLEKRLEASGP